MYWYLWSYWGIFTVSSYVLIPVVLLRNIYSIIVWIDTCGLTEGYLQYHCMILIAVILLRDIYSIIVCIDTCGLTEGYLQYHCMYVWYLSSYWGIFTVSSVCIDTCGLTEGYLQYHRIYWYLWSYWGIFTVSLYAIDTCTEGYLQYHQPDSDTWKFSSWLQDIYSIISLYSDNESFDLTEGYLQYHRMYWYLWS